VKHHCLLISYVQLLCFFIHSLDKRISRAALDRFLIFKFSNSSYKAIDDFSPSHYSKLPLNHSDRFVIFQVQLFLNLGLALALFNIVEPLACRRLYLHHLIFGVVSKLNFSSDDHRVYEFSESPPAEKTLNHLRALIFLCLGNYPAASFCHRCLWLCGDNRFFCKFPRCLVESHCFEQVLP